MGKEDWNGETMAWRKEPDERRPNPDMVSKYVWLKRKDIKMIFSYLWLLWLHVR